QELRFRGQVTEALADEQRRCEGAERFRADALRPRSPDIDIETHRRDGFLFGVLVELVLEAGGNVVEATLPLAAFRLQLLVKRAQTDAEVLGDALGDVGREASFLRRRFATGGLLEIRDRRQRQLVGNEGILDQERRGKEALARKAMCCRRTKGKKTR